MNYLSTSYTTFIATKQNEAINYDKIADYENKMRLLNTRLAIEKDDSKRKRIQLEIKVLQLKIMIAGIK